MTGRSPVTFLAATWISLGSVILLGACALTSGNEPNAPRSGSAAAGTPSAGTAIRSGGESARPGGTLYYLTKRPPEHLDPQRTSTARDLANLGRLVYRSLVQFPVTDDPDRATTPVPDLATDTGTSEHGGRQWSFTLKDGVAWQDGKAITCQDVKYGLSRAFAAKELTGAPAYALGYLDVPRRQGVATYQGPGTTQGQADVDRAVSCRGRTITYRFNRPWPDFPLAIAALRIFDPYRADRDRGVRSNLEIFSNGPYRLEGAWGPMSMSATFVRNPNYDPRTDGVRKALPDTIVFQLALPAEDIARRLIEDSGDDQTAVTDRTIPPAFFGQVTGSVAERSTLVRSSFTSFLMPNVTRMRSRTVRQAFAMATNKAAYSAALGGDRVSTPARSIINPLVPGYRANPRFTAPDAGDPQRAKTLLQRAGLRLPYPITVFCPCGGTPEMDNALVALKKGWDAAGFLTTIDPLGTMASFGVDPESDVVVTGQMVWWPTVSAVIPPAFDSRIVDDDATKYGPSYRHYTSTVVDTMIDEAMALGDPRQRAEAYAELDEHLGREFAYIPLDIPMFHRLHGSKITGYLEGPATSMYVDLGAIGVREQ
ncbi:MAG: ABC transporter substrate-binding protein [Kineosporiaceae bacterium]|nr:ABC transporter substrate-binding protein [Kineosporiaceae bacterium]MBK7624721.1 ABC transporter substrate-binding protein [Kineosporiaceae bacterium]MBK8076902.1 ABC transporter substrate-binding protein [Kineosporiaceae bacterium]